MTLFILWSLTSILYYICFRFAALNLFLNQLNTLLRLHFSELLISAYSEGHRKVKLVVVARGKIEFRDGEKKFKEKLRKISNKSNNNRSVYVPPINDAILYTLNNNEE